MDKCETCHRPFGTTRYVIPGYIGTYLECEWCFEGTERPEEPELITDSFTVPKEQTSIFDILDRMLIPENMYG